MIKIENVEIFGWQAAIRGMRNPLNNKHSILICSLDDIEEDVK